MYEVFSDRSCCGGQCRGWKCSLVVAGGSGGKSSQAWWRSPPHRRPPWGLETLWHIQWRYRGSHIFSTYGEAEHHWSKRCGRLRKRRWNESVPLPGRAVWDVPGGVELMVLGSCHQFWVNTNVFKHRLNERLNTKSRLVTIIIWLQKLCKERQG